MICKCCEEDKELTEFPVRKDRSGRLRPYCRDCANQAGRSRYLAHKRTSPFEHRCTRVKTRSKASKIPFDLTPEYLKEIWTGVCPVLNKEIKFTCSKDDEYAAELDKIVPSKGYVKGNVAWLSRRANRLKNNVTVKELKELIKWMETHESSFD